MVILTDILLISLICVYITDISGAIEDFVEPMLAKLFKRPKVKLKKPWSCSRCQTFWLGLIYLAITCNFTLPYIAYVCLLSMLAPIFNNILCMVMEALVKLTNAF